MGATFFKIEEGSELRKVLEAYMVLRTCILTKNSGPQSANEPEEFFINTKGTPWSSKFTLFNYVVNYVYGIMFIMCGYVCYYVYYVYYVRLCLLLCL